MKNILYTIILSFLLIFSFTEDTLANECSNLDWSNTPGAYELQLIRRCGNPYFSESRQVVSMEELTEAKKNDDYDYEIVVNIYAALLLYLNGIPDPMSFSEFNNARREIDDLIELSLGVGGRANEITISANKLRRYLIELVIKAFSNNSQALLALKNAIDFHKEYARKILNPLTLQILRERSPIRPDEVIATIVSENPETIRNYLIVMPEDARSLLKKGALLLMKDALDRGYIDNYFDEKIEVLSADYPDFYEEYNEKKSAYY